MFSCEQKVNPIEQKSISIINTHNKELYQEINFNLSQIIDNSNSQDLVRQSKLFKSKLDSNSIFDTKTIFDTNFTNFIIQYNSSFNENKDQNNLTLLIPQKSISDLAYINSLNEYLDEIKKITFNIAKTNIQSNCSFSTFHSIHSLETTKNKNGTFHVKMVIQSSVKELTHRNYSKIKGSIQLYNLHHSNIGNALLLDFDILKKVDFTLTFSTVPSSFVKPTQTGINGSIKINIDDLKEITNSTLKPS